MKNLAHLGIILMALPLSGCFTSMAMNGLNGAGACNPRTFALIQQNASTLASLPTDAKVTDLYSLFPPEKRERLLLKDDMQVEVWYYRTGHPRCRSITAESLTPVVIDRYGRILAIGTTQTNAYRSFALSRRPLS